MNSRVLILILIFLFNQLICEAQKKAVTDLGDEVILYENGTWKYSKEFEADNSNKIELNPGSFTKSKNASFLLKSSHGNLGYWVDPKKWTFSKNPDNPNTDFELEFKGQSLQGVIISEEVNIPVESYINIAIQNGRLSAPDLHILHKEYRMVNGLKVLHLQMAGTQVGVKFLYYAYYFSNENSTVQFLVASYATTIEKYKNEVEELLNGLTVIPSDSIKMEDNAGNKNTAVVTQGLYSPNNNCRKFFEGNWNYSVSGEAVHLERTFKKTFEYLDNRKYLFEYDNKWIDDCSYETIFKRTTKPDFKAIKSGESIKVDILEIDDKRMRYTVSFKGIDTNGEMIKEE